MLDIVGFAIIATTVVCLVAIGLVATRRKVPAPVSQIAATAEKVAADVQADVNTAIKGG